MRTEIWLLSFVHKNVLHYLSVVQVILLFAALPNFHVLLIVRA